MYAKSMIEYARARVVSSTLSRHLGFIPVALAVAVASLPFMLERQFLQSIKYSNSGNSSFSQSQKEARSEPMAMLENPFAGLVKASVVTAPKRVMMPLDAQQRAIATHITRKYGVSTDVVQELVRTAFAAGKQFGVDPLLVVAVMAVESSFNPIAESYAGAKGLMQIIPKYHLEKFAEFGGEHTIFDPRVNILVGARIIREYLLQASGDLFTALQTYAGALADRDAAYTHRVLNEKDQLDALAGAPKTDRASRITLQLDAVRPGTLVVPKIEAPQAQPLPGAAEIAAAKSATAAVTAAALGLFSSGAAAAPSVSAVAPGAKPVEEARHTPPTVPQPQQPAAAPGMNLTQSLPESVLRF